MRFYPLLVLATALQLGVLARLVAQEPQLAEANQPKPPSLDELLLFFPTKYPNGDWSPQGLRFQDVYFHAEDKTRLHGWYCPCDNPRAVSSWLMETLAM